MSAGFQGVRWTRHKFVRFEEFSRSELKYSAEHEARGEVRNPIALIYVCTETGAERRWGLI